jgi:hypothetical protein
MTHDCGSLSKRNRAVARSFKERDPDGFFRQRSTAGKLGFQATGGMHGWQKAHEKARQYRLENPSEPERWMMGVLSEAGFTDYEREYPLHGGYSLDFVLDGVVAIEVNGHQHKPSFGEGAPRAQGQREKIARFGGPVFIADATGDRELVACEVLEFLKARS